MDQYNCVHHLCVTRSGVFSVKFQNYLNKPKLSKAELAAVFSINSSFHFIFFELFPFFGAIFFIVKTIKMIFLQSARGFMFSKTILLSKLNFYSSVILISLLQVWYLL
jgi:hypothetical protein